MDDRSKTEAVQLGHLVLPVATPRARREPLALPVDGVRPKLYVITTPPEVRERYLRWVAIQQSALLTILITFALIAIMTIV